MASQSVVHKIGNKSSLNKGYSDSYFVLYFLLLYIVILYSNQDQYEIFTAWLRAALVA